MTSAVASSAFAEAILLGIVGLFAALLLLDVYRSYFLEAQRLGLRFKLFALRDDLEAMAVRGQLDGGAEEYILLRDGINGLIGQLERIGGIFLLYMMVAKTTRDQEKLRGKIKRCPELAMLYSRANELFAETVYNNSFFVRVVGRFQKLRGRPTPGKAIGKSSIKLEQISRTPIKARFEIVFYVRRVEELGNEYHQLGTKRNGQSLSAHTI